VHSAALTDVAFRCDGRAFVTSSFDASFALHDFSTGKASLHVQKAHGGVPVTSACFSRTGNILLTYGMDACAKLWDLRRVSSSSPSTSLISIQASLPSASSTSATRVLPSGNAASSGASQSTAVPAVSTPAVPVQVQSFGAPAKCEHRIKAKFNSHESLVVVQGSSLHEIQSFDIYSGNLIYTCAVGQSTQRAFAPHPYAPILISGGEDCKMRMWALSTLP